MNNAVDCHDVSFIIPFRSDGPDRLFNLNAILSFLGSRCANAELTIVEDAPHTTVGDILKVFPEVRHIFLENTGRFHKSAAMNAGILATDRAIVSLYDADMLMAPEAIALALKTIRTRKYPIVLPFNRICVDLSDGVRADVADTLSVADYGYFTSYARSKVSAEAEGRLIQGGVVFADRRTILKTGAMNRKMISYGWEDTEFLMRHDRLGHYFTYLDYSLVHLNHARGPDSQANERYEINRDEYLRVKAMPRGDLDKYVIDELSIVDRPQDLDAPSFSVGFLGAMARRVQNKVRVEGWDSLLPLAKLKATRAS